MGCTLGRNDYEELMILGEEAMSQPEEVREAIIESEYLKPTQAAALELRARGIDADAAKLDYLIQKGAIPPPSGGSGRNRRWTPEDIDRAYEHLEREGAYVPGAVARMVFNIDAAQDIRAQQRAFAEHPYLPPDPSYFVMEVFPGAPGVGLHSEVRYRPMTADEQWTQWARIEEATGKAVAR